MGYKKLLLIAFVFLLVCSSFTGTHPSVNKESQWFVAQYENVLGTSMDISVKTRDESIADKATELAIAEIKRLSGLLSAYDAGSELSKWTKTRGIPVKVSGELMEVLQLFDQWHQQTDGAIQSGYEEIAIVWKGAAAQQQMPDVASLREATRKAQQQHWQLNPVAGTATHLTDVPLVLNTFTKSYIIQKAVAAAQKLQGVLSINLNIGGDVVVAGDDAVTVPITNPFHSAGNELPLANIQVINKAVATSGNYRRGVNIQGTRYSHIIDTRTGWPAADIVSATVIAKDAVLAGALATAFTILSPEQSKQIAARYSAVEYLLIDKNGKIIISDTWSGPIPAAIQPIKSDISSADQLWNKGYILQIDLEVARISEQFVHRPFVAIWVQDANQKPIKLLSVWFNKPKWLRDLREFFKNYGANFSPGAFSMSASAGATRSAGKYSIVWDGKDEAGNYVPPGTYAIQIEAAREHGTYQMMSGSIECSKKPATITIPGNTEIAGATISYTNTVK